MNPPIAFLIILLDPYRPPSFLTFSLLALTFPLSLLFLPRFTSRAITAFLVTALSIFPTLISTIWVYRFHHSLAAGFAGGGDPLELMRHIFNTTLGGIVMSSLMLIISGVHTFWLQKVQPKG